MHPAYSVIFFTTASGAGYGLLAFLGVLGAAGVVPPDRWLGVFGLGLSLALITAGLLSSTAHLGRPQRAWRAFSEWRTSWLSREGVLAVATYVPAVLFTTGWVFFERTDGWVAVAGLLASVGAVLTVCATAMIYASLKPIPQWNSSYTLPVYLLMAAMTGLSLLCALTQISGSGSILLVAAAVLITLGCWLLKRDAWRAVDATAMPATLNSATGLSDGAVRSIEWPHSEENYLLKEMGYRIARKHAIRLRLVAQVGAFMLPSALLCLALLFPRAAFLTVPTSATLQLAGVLIERWLFFAEAKHTITLYYGR